MAKARDFKFCTLVHHVTEYHWDYKLSLEWAWLWSSDVFKFWEISNNISETVHDTTMEANRKSLYPIEWHDCRFDSTTISTICLGLHVNWKLQRTHGL